jgi:hypothetical protein
MYLLTRTTQKAHPKFPLSLSDIKVRFEAKTQLGGRRGQQAAAGVPEPARLWISPPTRRALACFCEPGRDNDGLRGEGVERGSLRLMVWRLSGIAECLIEIADLTLQRGVLGVSGRGLSVWDVIRATITNTALLVGIFSTISNTHR